MRLYFVIDGIELTGHVVLEKRKCIVSYKQINPDFEATVRTDVEFGNDVKVVELLLRRQENTLYSFDIKRVVEMPLSVEQKEHLRGFYLSFGDVIKVSALERTLGVGTRVFRHWLSGKQGITDVNLVKLLNWAVRHGYDADGKYD